MYGVVYFEPNYSPFTQYLTFFASIALLSFIIFGGLRYNRNVKENYRNVLNAQRILFGSLLIFIILIILIFCSLNIDSIKKIKLSSLNTLFKLVISATVGISIRN